MPTGLLRTDGCRSSDNPTPIIRGGDLD
jgi:hypothetical protein